MSSLDLCSPVDGSVAAVQATSGEVTTANATLVTLRAGESVIPVTAPMDGLVVGLLVAEGEQVSEGQPLVRMAPAPDAAASTA